MAEPVDPNNPNATMMSRSGAEGAMLQPGNAGVPGVEQPKTFKLRQYDFYVQFLWQPEPRGKRLEKMAQKKAAPAPGTTEPSTAAVGSEPAAAGS
jgi:hypothetical protein